VLLHCLIVVVFCKDQRGVDDPGQSIFNRYLHILLKKRVSMDGCRLVHSELKEIAVRVALAVGVGPWSPTLQVGLAAHLRGFTASPN
jgi:hypothetical protein